ncbi:choice-of-anchor U domain-containing protein [Methanotorris igneus]|nr:choice-of-anchor U domain-containing protein [Methanotorris igneus]
MINLKILKILAITIFGIILLNSVVGSGANCTNATTQSNGTIIDNQTDPHINNLESLNNTNNSIKTKNTNLTNNNYLDIKIEGYKIIIKTDGEPFGYISSSNQSITNNISLEFIKIGNDEYVVHPVVLNVPITICSKYDGNKILNRTIFLNCSLNHTTITRTDKPYLITKYENNSLIIKTNGKLQIVYDSMNISAKVAKIGHDLYRVYPLILNNTVIIYSKFDNETLNKTIFLNYTKPKEEHYLNVSIENYKLKVFTNGELTATILNKKVNISIKKLNNSEYIVYPLLLNSTIVLYSKFNNETLNKTIYLPYNNYSDKKTIIYNNLPFNFYINRGKFKKFDIDINNNSVFLEIDNFSGSRIVNLTIELPFEVPSGMHIYYWANVNGKLTPINYTILKDRKHVVIFLKDEGIDSHKKNRKYVVMSLKDKKTNKHKKESGKITGSFKFYIPKFNVKTEFMDNNKTGILHVHDLKRNESYNITIKIDKGKFDYLYFVDTDNIPIKSNVNLPYNLIKFKITDIPNGSKVKVNITYPKLSVGDGGIVYYYKFNPNTLKWYNIPVMRNGTTITFTLKDGSLGDDDGKTNGVIVDDGGVGWVGFTKPNIATIGVTANPVLHHWYKTLVPYGKSSFNISVEDMDSVRLKVYYPNGTFYGEFYDVNDTSNNFGEWATFTINTNGQYGWWKFELYRTSTYKYGDYYGLNVTNELLSWNESVEINGENFTTTPFIYMLGYNSNTLQSESYYVLSNGSFEVAIYDSDNLNVTVYYPNGTQYGVFHLTGNNTWDVITVTSDVAGLYKIVVEETDISFDDSIGSTTFSNRNLYRIASNKPIFMASDENELNVTIYSYNKTVSVGDTFNITVYVKNIGDFDLENINVTINLPSGLTGETSKTVSYILPNEIVAINFTVTASDSGLYEVKINASNDFVKASNTTYITVLGNTAIEGYIYEDFGILGAYDSQDKPIPNVTVALFKDNTIAGIIGKLDTNDTLVTTTKTNSSGYYNFTITDTSAIYFVAVNSSSINTTRGLNSGYTTSDIWAEETYQTNESNYSQIIPFFGGRNATKSDDWSAGVYEHYVKINCSKYKGENIIFGFNFDVIVNVKDADDDTSSNRYAQGTLRQFILNANAIKGADHMYFIPMVSPNENDGTGEWWKLVVNSTIGELPNILDDNTTIDGTAYYPNMTVRDDNPGKVGTGGTVGTGPDGIPNTGDEAVLPRFDKPEFEIDGNGESYIFYIGSSTETPANVTIRKIAIIGSGDDGIRVNGGSDNFLIEENIIGMRADGTYPDAADRIKGDGIKVYDYSYPSVGGTIQKNYVGYCEDYGISVGLSKTTGDEPLKTVIRWNEVFDAGKDSNYKYPDAISVYADNVTVEENLIYNVYMGAGTNPRSAGKGVEIRYNANGIIVRGNTISNTSSAGVYFDDDSDDGTVEYNIIYNTTGGVVVSDYSGSPVRIKISKNSIYNNSYLGIDLNWDNVTLNDGQLNANQPNYGMDYPVITYAEFNGTYLYVEGFIGNESIGGSSNFANATVDIYLVKNPTEGDDLVGNNISSDGSVLSNHYGEGWIYLGSLTANGSGDFKGWINVSGKSVENRALITATATLNGSTSEFGPDYKLIKKINISAGITLFWQGDHFNVTISVKAYNETHNIIVYWVKPNNTTISSMSGDYDSNGSSGNVYWWYFDKIGDEEVKHIYVNFNVTKDFRLSEAYIIGVDPK